MGHPKLKTLDPDDLNKNVRAAQRGDEEALAWLITQTKERLLRFVYFLCGDAALAQDLSQDTYLYAMEHLGELKEPAAFPRWIFLIAKNRFFDHQKSPRNKAHDTVENLDRMGKFAHVQDQELWVGVSRCLGELKPEDRAVLLLVDLEGYSYGEASEALKLSESALTSRLYRARAAFHKIYFRS
jgi:RNA polymerase sigma-70 factor, ECF subfamily